MEMNHKILSGITKMRVQYFCMISVLTLSLFSQPLSGQAAGDEKQKKSMMELLKKEIPAQADVVVFFDFSHLKKNVHSLAAFAESISSNLVMYMPANTKAGDPAATPDAAVFVGNEKTGYVLFPCIMPQKKFVESVRKNASAFAEHKFNNRIYYAGNFTPSAIKNTGKGSFVFTFVTPEIVAVAENRRSSRNLLVSSLETKKGLSPAMEKLLSARRKGAFIYGGIHMKGIQKRVGRFFPASAGLNDANFDVCISPGNTLNMQMIIEADSAETAASLAMVLNSYKMLLTGLLRSAEANAAQQAGTAVKLTPPERLVNITIENTLVKLVMDIPAEMLKTLGAFAVMTGMTGK